VFVKILSSESHNLINWASKYEMVEILQFLKHIGCNLNVKVNEYAPLHTACRFGSNESIEFLLTKCTLDK